MAPELSHNLITFHALSGCNNTSFIAGHSKKTMWQVFKDHHELLCGLGDGDLTQDAISSTEAFVCHTFNDSDRVHTTNEARFMLFSLVRKPEALPLMSEVWKQANYSQPNLPSPTDSGWKYEDGRHIPILMSRQSISESCMELVSCQCKTGCQVLLCTCRKSKVHCTQSCKCSNLANNIPWMNITDSDWQLVILRTISFHCSFDLCTLLWSRNVCCYWK